MDLGIRGLGPGVRIGLGASAAVYRARQEQLGRDVAVKLLTERDPSFVRRFEREALALGQLSRLPGILTVHDSGLTEQGEPYLVLQYCPSSLLDRLHREGPLAPGEAARLIARVAVTVAGAHEAGIVHRDLKPANILLSHEGEPLVADLGMASVLGAGITTSIGFTPGYAAPENLRGEPGGPDVDVYALGASLFQLVTGRVPFTDPSGLNNLVALAVAIDSQPVEDLRPVGVPDELCLVIEAAMAKDPARRPTAAALAEQLTAVATRIGTAAHARPMAPEIRPRVQHLAAWGPAPATLDGPVDPSPAIGVGLLTPPRPGGPGLPLPPLADAPPPADDLPAWARPRRAPPPDPYRVGLLPFKPWTRNPVDLFRRRPPRPAPYERMPRRRLGIVAAFGGAAVSGVVVALLTSVLPSIGEGGGAPQFAPTSTATTAFFLTTTTDPNGLGGSGTTWGPSLENSTPNMAGYELQWTADRANAVAGLTAPGVLDAIRPATDGCAGGWSDTAGVDGTAITLDLLVPDPAETGSEPVRLAQGIIAYLNWVNANGGIGPDRLTVTPRLVDQRRGVTTTGPGQPLAVAALDPRTAATVSDSLSAACIPEPLTVSRSAAADPAATPWMTPGPELSLGTEARLWAELIAQQVGAGPGTTATAVGRGATTTAPQGTTTSASTTTTGPGQRIVALVGSSETGALYRQAFDRALADRPSLPVTYVSSVTDLATGTVPAFLIVMGSPEDCKAAMATLPEEAQVTPIKIVAAPCVTPSQTATLSEAAGWLSLPGGVRDAMTYSYSDDAFQRLISDELFGAGLDSADPVVRRGFGLYGWLWQQSLEIAAVLPGGLTRSNLAATQRQLSGLTHPMLLDGITLKTGPDDPWLIEGSDVSVWNGSAEGVWSVDGVLDVNGQTPA